MRANYYATGLIFFMELKSSLHIHTAEDRFDGVIIKYNIYRLIDKAQKLGFKVLALTCHKKFVYKKEYGDYARREGILLIPGVELAITKFIFFHSDIVVLNCGKDAEQVKTFEQLREYKKNNPRIFVIAPHPLFDFKNSIGRNKLIEYIDIFDAVEHSWFYSDLINFNKKAKRIAEKYNKPFIATSDAHTLNYFNVDYAVISADELTVENVFKSIRQKKFKNITRPKNIFKLIFHIIIFKLKIYLSLPFRRSHNSSHKSTNQLQINK